MKYWVLNRIVNDNFTCGYKSNFFSGIASEKFHLWEKKKICWRLRYEEIKQLAVVGKLNCIMEVLITETGWKLDFFYRNAAGLE